MANYTFKICLLGDGGVGKSSLIRLLRTGSYEEEYLPTVGVEVHPLEFYTNYGLVRFSVWDMAGKDQFVEKENCYIQSDGAIIMFDVSNVSSYQHVGAWYDSFTKGEGCDAPIVICGGRADVERRVVPKKYNICYQERVMPCYDISSKKGQDVDGPFLNLARALTGHRDLEFIELEWTPKREE